MSYSRDDFKLSFLKNKAQFFVNEKKRIVSCVVEGELQSPYNWNSSVSIGYPTLKGTGVATCKDGDVFDVERGKRIALAVAENDVASIVGQIPMPPSDIPPPRIGALAFSEISSKRLSIIIDTRLNTTFWK